MIDYAYKKLFFTISMHLVHGRFPLLNLTSKFSLAIQVCVITTHLLLLAYKYLASCIHCHHPHQDNSSRLSHRTQGINQGIQIHYYQGLIIHKMVNCQIKHILIKHYHLQVQANHKKIVQKNDAIFSIYGRNGIIS